MSGGRDALLEILKTDTGLRFTFLDRGRPSLSYEQALEVPEAVFDDVAAQHVGILKAVGSHLVRSLSSTVQEASDIQGATRQIHDLAEAIRSSLFPADLLAHIRDFAPSTLLIRTNCPVIPWELSRLNGDLLGLKVPTGRSLLTQRPLRRITQRLPTRKMTVLIIANPTEDLAGADREADALVELFSQSPFFEFRLLQGREANLRNVGTAIGSGDFDVIHYAGHSDFVGSHGHLALYDTTISGQYLAKMLENNPPRFFFLNSCNSAIVESATQLFDDLLGVAPNLLRVGVDAVIGANWPVIDAPAVRIATEFYQQVGAGVAVGAALNRARRSTPIGQEVPYWLGYSLFGDPNLRLRDDDSWKASSIRSGGRVAATSTFTGRASLHVSSLHSFLMSAEETDTCAVALACECRQSEALVRRRDTDLEAILRERPLRVGVPGRTGSGIFVRKMLAEIGLPLERCRFIELDTAEVQLALQRGAIDVTAMWYPSLAELDLDVFDIQFSTGPNDYTICVLVARTPRTDDERTAAANAARAFSALASTYRQAPSRWACLLAEQMGLPLEQVLKSLPAYDFTMAGLTSLASAPEGVVDFIEREIAFLKAEGLLDANFDPAPVLLPLAVSDGLAQEPDVAMSRSLVADIQWSVSSLPLLIGRYLRYFS